MLAVIARLRRELRRRHLVARDGVLVAPDSKVHFEKVSYRENCELVIGHGSIVQTAIVFERPGSTVRIGENTFVGGGLLATAQRISIGSDVLIAWGTTVVDHDSHSLHWSQRSNDVRDWYSGRKDWSCVLMKAVTIQDRAWLGFNCAVLKGVTIGEGAVVAACSVVTRDVPPYTLVAGNPAREVRKLHNTEDQICPPEMPHA